MFRIIGCLTEQHDNRLVLLAAIVCAATSVAAFHMYSRVEHAQGPMRGGWLFMTGLCTAAGIWATHFVAMLAYQPPIPVAYDPGLTAASLVIAIGATTLGFLVASSGRALLAWAGGAIIGIGISIMHFTGMRALVLAGHIEWDPGLVVTAIVLGATLGSTAMAAFQRLTGVRAVAAGAGLFTLAICAMHFTAMGAATIVPDPTVIPTSGFSADPPMMAFAIAGFTTFIIVAGLSAALIDRQTNLDSLERIRELADAASEGIVIAKDGVIINVNRRVSELCGRPIADLVGKQISGELLCETSMWCIEDASRTVEGHLKVHGGGRIPVEVVSRPLRSGGRGNEVHAIRDLTERRQSEAQISHMARHDALTGLPNRVSLRERLEQSLEQLQEGDVVAILRVGLDRFNEVNLALGHAVGDSLLKAASIRLSGCIRETDMVARVGGDEFKILQHASNQPADASAFAARVITVLAVPFDLDGHEVTMGASIGIALASAGSGPDELLRNADMALRRAKREGRGSYRFFEKEMDERVTVRRLLEAGLRTALSNNELELHYQPIQNLERNEIAGFEALMRWNHPLRGRIPPSEFIPLAEETGLIVQMGEWALKEACAEAARWPEQIKIAINISPRQFKSPDLTASVTAAIVGAGISPNRVELEITETVLLEDSETTLKVLSELKAFGVRIALDDFGTGYSSLSYLTSFPFNKLKIDASFVRALTQGGDSALAVVRAIIQMGRSLGMATTAEGVETKAQLDMVRAEGCTEVQGYLFSPPKPAHEITKLLASAKLTDAA